MAEFYYNKYNIKTTYTDYTISSSKTTYYDPPYTSGYIGSSYRVINNSQIELVSPTYFAHGFRPGYRMAGSGPGSSVQYCSGGDRDLGYEVTTYRVVPTNPTHSRGTLVQSNLIAEDGAYPNNGVKDGYWYVKQEAVNAVPWISGVDEHKGGLVKGFTYTYKVDDPDINQELTVTTNFNGESKTDRNVLRQTEYNFTVTDEMFNALELGMDYTITIVVSDGSGASATRRITFKRINSAPKIVISNKKLGLQNEPFTIEYSVSDLENDIVNVEFSHKGKVLDTVVDVTLDTPQSWTIDSWDFVQIFNGNNAILVKAIDEHGSSSTDVAEFTKEVYGCEIIDHEPVDRICDYIIVEAHHDLYEKIDTGEIEVLELQVTNNFHDENPVWEDVELGKVHTFTNKIATGTPAIGVRYKILADPQYGDSYFYSFTYHWGWTS